MGKTGYNQERTIEEITGLTKALSDTKAFEELLELINARNDVALKIIDDAKSSDAQIVLARGERVACKHIKFQIESLRNKAIESQR